MFDMYVRTRAICGFRAISATGGDVVETRKCAIDERKLEFVINETWSCGG